jgi:beta-1,4-glucosyltransferase
MRIPLFKSQDSLIRRLKLVEESELGSLLKELRSVETPTVIGFLNQHGYNIAQQETRVRQYFGYIKYLLRDGMGIKIACKLNGRDPKANLNGSDFIPKLIGSVLNDSSRDHQFFAMGTQEPWLSQGANVLFKGNPVATIDGFQSTEAYLRFFHQHHQPGKMPVMLLAMGMPKQEEVAVMFKQQLDVPALIICGGAVLDFSANRFARAPEAFRKVGMEWLYRLLMEPRRLFKRYVVGIPLFFFYLLRNGLNSHVRVGRQSVANRQR